MKVEVKKQGGKEAEKKYPYLGRSSLGHKSVVLFTAPNSGVCLSGYPDRNFFNTWRENEFAPLSSDEQVVLSND